MPYRTLRQNAFMIKLAKNQFICATFVAICFTLLASFFTKSLLLKDNNVLIFNFLSAVLIYGFHGVNVKIKNKKKYVLFFYIILLITIFYAIFNCFFLLTKPAKIAAMLLSFLCFAYRFKLFGLPALRSVPKIKILIISFVWATALVLLVVLNQSKTMDFSVIFSFLSAFLYVIGLTIAFDIRDLQTDPKELKTFAQSLGIKKAKQLSFFLLIFSVLSFLLTDTYIKNKIAFFLMCFVAFIGVYHADNKKPNYYFCFLLEACSLIPWILTHIF